MTAPADGQEPAAEALPANLESAVDSVLTLRDVITSVYVSYPLLEIARLEQQVAEGKELAAWGEFDLSLKAFGAAEPLGYYRNSRHGVGLTQPTSGGGYLYGGYKLGRGDIPPWYKERETDKGGEFTLGLGMPLLKDRAIDKRRSAVSQAAADRMERARLNLDLAGETSQLGQEAFNAGDIDLIALNIYEQTRTDAQFQWIEAQADFFIAQADYHAAVARDPLAD